MIQKKIQYKWGYNVGNEPPYVVLSKVDGVLSIAHWPDDNPPTIAEIEAVVLPTPPPEPDWATFRLSMLGSDAFLRIANSNAALFTILNSVMWLIASDPSKMVETAVVWNKLADVALPTEAEIAELNGIASTNNIPLSLNAQGKMG